MILGIDPRLQRESFGELPFVDEAVVFNIVLHPGRCFNVHRWGERVDVTRFNKGRMC